MQGEGLDDLRNTYERLKGAEQHKNALIEVTITLLHQHVNGPLIPFRNFSDK